MEIELEILDAHGVIHRRTITSDREPVPGDKFRVKLDRTDVECTVSSVYRREDPEPKIVAIVYQSREPGVGAFWY